VRPPIHSRNGWIPAALRHARPLLTVPFLAALLTVAYAGVEPTRYEASTAIISGSGFTEHRRLEGLSPELGVDPVLTAPSVSPRLYGSTMVSREVLEAVVDERYRITLPDGATREGDLAALLPRTFNRGLTPREAAVRQLERSTMVHVDHRTGIVYLRVTSPWPQLSEAIVARLLAQADGHLRQGRRGRFDDERRFSSEQSKAAEEELRRAEDFLLAFVTGNRAFGTSGPLVLEYARRLREVSAKREVYLAVLLNAEDARFAQVGDSPLITVLDRPEDSAVRVGSRVVVRSAFAALLGGALTSLVVLMRLLLWKIRPGGRHRRPTEQRPFGSAG
jgi:uncharacterized protein involved in exopolysaccharide biosynthesis